VAWSGVRPDVTHRVPEGVVSREAAKLATTIALRSEEQRVLAVGLRAFTREHHCGSAGADCRLADAPAPRTTAACSSGAPLWLDVGRIGSCCSVASAFEFSGGCSGVTLASTSML